MNKTLMWSIIGVVFILLLIVIIVPNMVGSLSMDKPAVGESEQWMHSPEKKVKTGDMEWLDKSPVEDSKEAPMMDFNEQNDVSGSETPADSETPQLISEVDND